MDSGKWTVAGVLTAFMALMAFVVLSACEVDECGEPSVWVGIKVDDDDYHASAVYKQAKHMPKDLPCESVETPVNGGYEITTVSDEVTNNTQHTIQYHCDRGYELVGHSNRTCNGTSKQWTTEEPHCEPQYVNQFKQKWKTTEDKVNDVDIKVADIANKVADIEKKTTTTVNKVTDIDNKMTTTANKMAFIDNKMTTTANKMTDIDNRMTTAVHMLIDIEKKTTTTVNKVADIDDRLTAYASSSKNTDDRVTTIINSLASIDAKLTTLQAKQTIIIVDSRMTTTNSTLTPVIFDFSEFNSAKERLSKAGQLATVAFINGSLVSQFTFTVNNFEEELSKAERDHASYVKSEPFYTGVPGYQVQLRVDPNFANTGYVGVFMSVMEGEFDDFVSWPFRNRIEVTSADRDGGQIGHVQLNPIEHEDCSTAFSWPPNCTVACGFSNFIKIKTLLSNKSQYLIDGRLTMKFTFRFIN